MQLFRYYTETAFKDRQEKQCTSQDDRRPARDLTADIIEGINRLEDETAAQHGHDLCDRSQLRRQR